jgi:sulfite reductase (NADPH) hemoprotein beta-component
MYQYTDFDKHSSSCAQQFRDQLERWQRGKLSDEQIPPLRLQNGWYIQRYAPWRAWPCPTARSAAPAARAGPHRARVRPAQPAAGHAQATRTLLEASQPGARRTALQYGYGHFTTRTNVQFNWIPLTRRPT